jgi:FAD-dependent urate hydroxylase
VMGFWRRAMPAGMLLRSERPGSHIADPQHALTFDRYEAEQERSIPRRMSLDEFIDYGMWYQRRAVPEVDSRKIERIDCQRGEFRLTLETGETVRARRVVIATGLQGLDVRPAAFAPIPRAFAPHSSEVCDPSVYRGLSVIVVGAGQSALELAALLHEAGAEVEIVARRPALRFLSGRDWLRSSPVHKLIYPPSELGPPGVNWIIELPDLFRSLPLDLQRRVALQVGPVGAAWLRPRLAEVKATTGRSIGAAEASGGRLRVVLDDRSTREVDRVILATGYRVDVDRMALFPRDLAQRIRRMNGCPELSSAFESSVPGLFFVGAAATASFGPIMRFVAGTGYAARAITRHVVGLREEARAA